MAGTGPPEQAPAAPLRGLVSYHGYDVRAAAPGRHRGLPSPWLTLIVTFGPELEMRLPDGTLVRRPTVLGGLHADPVVIEHGARQSGVHVSLHPLAARALLGRPAADLAGVDVDAADVLGRAGTEIYERVGAAAGWRERFAVLDEVLLRRVVAADRTPAVSPEVRRAWRRLVGGRAGVAETAREVGWSERHLGQRFREETGVGPKVAARMARFDRARHELGRRATAGGGLDLAGLAVACGFADQPHLNREFRAFAGCAPTRWLAEEITTGEIGNVQDAPAPGPDDGPHD